MGGWYVGGGRRRRKKTEQESSAKCDYRRLAESFGFSSPLSPASSCVFSFSLSLLPSFSLSHSLPFFLLPSDARLPSRCSYVQLASRLRTEERKTWVLIRAHRGCGSSRRYFMANRLPSPASSLLNTCLFVFVN